MASRVASAFHHVRPSRSAKWDDQSTGARSYEGWIDRLIEVAYNKSALTFWASIAAWRLPTWWSSFDEHLKMISDSNTEIIKCFYSRTELCTNALHFHLFNIKIRILLGENTVSFMILKNCNENSFADFCCV